MKRPYRFSWINVPIFGALGLAWLSVWQLGKWGELYMRKDLTNASWQRLNNQPVRQANKPLISIRSKGEIGFNKPATGIFLNSVSYAEIYYDPRLRVLGIRPHPGPEAGDDGLFRVRYPSSGAGGISARAHLREWGLLTRRAVHFRPYWSDEHTMVVIDLDDPLDPVPNTGTGSENSTAGGNEL